MVKKRYKGVLEALWAKYALAKLQSESGIWDFLQLYMDFDAAWLQEQENKKAERRICILENLSFARTWSQDLTRFRIFTIKVKVIMDALGSLDHDHLRHIDILNVKQLLEEMHWMASVIWDYSTIIWILST